MYQQQPMMQQMGQQPMMMQPVQPVPTPQPMMQPVQQGQQSGQQTTTTVVVNNAGKGGDSLPSIAIGATPSTYLKWSIINCLFGTPLFAACALYLSCQAESMAKNNKMDAARIRGKLACGLNIVGNIAFLGLAIFVILVISGAISFDITKVQFIDDKLSGIQTTDIWFASDSW